MDIFVQVDLWRIVMEQTTYFKTKINLRICTQTFQDNLHIKDLLSCYYKKGVDSNFKKKNVFEHMHVIKTIWNPYLNGNIFKKIKHLEITLNKEKSLVEIEFVLDQIYSMKIVSLNINVQSNKCIFNFNNIPTLKSLKIDDKYPTCLRIIEMQPDNDSIELLYFNRCLPNGVNNYSRLKILFLNIVMQTGTPQHLIKNNPNLEILIIGTINIKIENSPNLKILIMVNKNTITIEPNYVLNEEFSDCQTGAFIERFFKYKHADVTMYINKTFFTNNIVPEKYWHSLEKIFNR